MPQGYDEGTIVVDTKLHCCQACHAKVYKAISGQPGVESFNIDLTSSKVTLKAPKADPQKLFKTLQKKSGGKIRTLLHPNPKDAKKEEKKEETNKKPKEVTVELEMNLDCHSCIEKVEKAAWKLKDVESVKVVDHEKLIVRGWDLDPKKVCNEISKKSKKHAEIVPPKKDASNPQKGGNTEKKEEATPKIVTQYVYAYPSHYFITEYAKNEERGTPTFITTNAYGHPPQYFSDENPDACAIM